MEPEPLAKLSSKELAALTERLVFGAKMPRAQCMPRRLYMCR